MKTHRQDPTPTAPPTREEQVRALQVDIHGRLTEITTAAGLVQQLTDTHQRGIGFLTHAARAALGKQWLDEHAARRQADANGQPHGSGPTATPGNFTGIAASVQVWAGLRDLIRRGEKHLLTRGVCTIYRTRDGAGTVVLAHVLQAQVPDIDDPGLLTRMAHELAGIRDLANAVVEGNDKTTLGDCPWCGYDTLVVYLRDGIVRCDRDPKTGHFTRCVCPNPLCQCKVSPVTYRHTWHRDKGTASDGWHALRRERDNRTRALAPTPPKENRQ